MSPRSLGSRRRQARRPIEPAPKKLKIKDRPSVKKKGGRS